MFRNQLLPSGQKRKVHGIHMDIKPLKECFKWDKESYGIDLQAIRCLVGDDFSSWSYLV